MFDKLNNEVKEIHTMYTEYAKSVNSKVEKFKTERPAPQSFLPTKMKEIKAAREFFTLDYFSISEEEVRNLIEANKKRSKNKLKLLKRFY